MSSFLNEEKYEISVWEDQLISTEGPEYSYFKENKVAIIAANDMVSKYGAFNTQFIEKINGEKTLIFSLYYSLFDEDKEKICTNPFVSLLTNERKVKLFYKDQWYDFIIKSCQENSQNKIFTYTAKQLYINELGKNGFKVELDDELENNQGTVVQLGKAILADTDWQVDEENSDILVESKIEPLYCGTVKKGLHLYLKPVANYMPNPNMLEENWEEKIIDLYIDSEDEESKPIELFFFYSDLIEENEHPFVLYREDGEYKVDLNNDIITNAYNYQIFSGEVSLSQESNEELYSVFYYDSYNDYKVPNFINPLSFKLNENYRGEKVVRQAVTGYDNDLDKFITKYCRYELIEAAEGLYGINSVTKQLFHKSKVTETEWQDYLLSGGVTYKKEVEKAPNGKIKIYNGYTETEAVSPKLAQNFLANSKDFTTLDNGWYFDTYITNDSDNAAAKLAGEIHLESGITNVLEEEITYFDSSLEQFVTTTYYYKYIKDPAGDYGFDENAKVFFKIKDSYTGQKYRKELAENDTLLTLKLGKNENGKEIKAINTGLAANRQIIKEFSDGEEYVFAASIGKYEEVTDIDGNVTTTSIPKLGDKVDFGKVTFDAIYNKVKTATLDTYFQEAWYQALLQQIGDNSLEPVVERNSYISKVYEILDNILEDLLTQYIQKGVTINSCGEAYLYRVLSLFGKFILSNNFSYNIPQEIFDYYLSKRLLDQELYILNNDLVDFETYLYNNFNFNNYFNYSISSKQLIKCTLTDNIYCVRVDKEKYNNGTPQDSELTYLSEGTVIYLCDTGSQPYFLYNSKYSPSVGENYLKGYKYRVVSPVEWKIGENGKKYPSFSSELTTQYNLDITFEEYNNYSIKNEAFGSFETEVGALLSEYKDYNTNLTINERNYIQNLFVWISKKNNNDPVNYYDTYSLLASIKLLLDIEIHLNQEIYSTTEWISGDLNFLMCYLGRYFYTFENAELEPSSDLLAVEQNPLFHFIVQDLKRENYLKNLQDEIYIRHSALLTPEKIETVEELNDDYIYRALLPASVYEKDIFVFDEQLEGYRPIIDITEIQPKIYLPKESANGEYIYDKEQKVYRPYLETDDLKCEWILFNGENIEYIDSPIRYNLEVVDKIPETTLFLETGEQIEELEKTSSDSDNFYVLGREVKNFLQEQIKNWTGRLFSELGIDTSLETKDFCEAINDWFKNNNMEELDIYKIITSVFDGVEFVYNEGVGLIQFPYNNTIIYINKDIAFSIENIAKNLFKNENYVSGWVNDWEDFSQLFWNLSVEKRKETLLKEILIGTLQGIALIDIGTGLEKNYGIIENKMLPNRIDFYFKKIGTDLKGISYTKAQLLNSSEVHPSLNEEIYYIEENLKGWEEIIQYNKYNYRHRLIDKYTIKPLYCIQDKNTEGTIIYRPYNNKTNCGKQGYEIIDEGLGKDLKKKEFPENCIFSIPQKETFTKEKYEHYEAIRYRAFRVNYNSGYIKVGKNYRRYQETDGIVEEFYNFQFYPNGELIYNNGIFEPYEPNIEDLKETYVFEVSEEDPKKEQYVKYNDQFISLTLAKQEYLGTAIKQYEGLKIKLCTNYQYHAEDFLIDKVVYGEPETAQLVFDCSLPTDGSFSTIVGTYSDKSGEHIVKEKWIYWRTKVKTQGQTYNFAEDTSSVGLVFESDKTNLTTYIFYGLQFFKYYEYFENNADNEEELSRQVKMVYPDLPLETKNYYSILYKIYEEQTPIGSDKVNYLYTGYNPLSEPTASFEGKKYIWDYYYDKDCNKVRSIKGKESSYFGLIQNLLETFECWADYVIDHDEYGRIKYKDTIVLEEFFEQNVDLNSISVTPQLLSTNFIDKGIYELNENQTFYSVNETNTPIIYELTNEEKNNLSIYTSAEVDLNKAILKGSLSLSQVTLEDLELAPNEYIPALVVNNQLDLTEYYQNSENGEFPIDKPLLVKVVYKRKISVNDEEILKIYTRIFRIRIIKTPIKKVQFKQYVGKENYAGFKYGVNLNSIQRNIVSDNLISKLIVKTNSNEYANNGFCTIQRAKDNYIKENFICDFDYYIRHQMLKYNEVLLDLYSLSSNGIGYYYKLAKLNKDLEKLADDIVITNELLDQYKSDYQVNYFSVKAAEEKINELYTLLINAPAGSGEMPSLPSDNAKWEFYQSKAIVYNSYGIAYYKYNDQMRTYLDQMDTYQGELRQSEQRLKIAEENKVRTEKKLKELLIEDDKLTMKKIELNKLFFNKYSRFIQEGSWVSEEYIDDDLYYLDALSVLRNSIFPKITYQINVTDLSSLPEYKIFEFEIGDRTYIEDTDYFGYSTNGKPYQEQIIISEYTHFLGSPEKNQLKVQNFRTQYEDLFSRITATVQSLSFNEGSYGKTSTLLDENGNIKSDKLSASIEAANMVVAAANNQRVNSDNTGITITSETGAGVLKIINSGIYISSDGTNYIPVITSQGINLTSALGGRLDIDKILVGASSTPNFMWDKYGISAFSKKGETVDYSNFIRYDEFGLYGILSAAIPQEFNGDVGSINNDKLFDPREINENPLVAIKENAAFGLTWDGFFFNSFSQDGTKGKVSFGSEQDLRMSIQSEDGSTWQDQVIIGRMQDINNKNYYYGFRLLDKSGTIVLDTDQTGELYLRKKLRISNFNDPMVKNGSVKWDENGELTFEGEKEVYSSRDRVTLGIVDTYKRENGNYLKTEESLVGTYSSQTYLTKIMSIKTNTAVGLEQWQGNEMPQGLIENDETFAIFDNGNLFAKNAWLEGHIRAKSGNIIGALTVGEQTSNDGIIINGKTGSIEHSGGKWYINEKGEAKFFDVVTSGKIMTSVFETDSVQSINGTMLVAPIYEVLEVKTLKTDSEEIEAEISLKTGTYTNKSGEIIYSDLPEYYKSGGFCLHTRNGTTIKDYYKITTKTNNKIIIKADPNSFEKGDYITGLGNTDSENTNEVIIGINALTNDGIVPRQAFSIFSVEEMTNSVELDETTGEIESSNDRVVINSILHTVLGKLTNIKGLPVELNNSYGLYCDNVYLRGTISAETLIGDTNYSVGFSTRPYTEDKINPVFWAGPKDNPNFLIDKSGKMKAEGGYFSGTIETAVIQTSKVYGKGASTLEITEEKASGYQNYGLTIIGNQGIVFGEEGKNGTTLTLTPYFQLQKEGMIVNVSTVLSNGVKLFDKISNNIYLFDISKSLTEDKIQLKYRGESRVNIFKERFQFETETKIFFGNNAYIDSNENGYDIYVKEQEG